MNNTLAYFKYKIDKCVNENHAYREALKAEIQKCCDSQRARGIKPEDQLGHWVDFLNGN